MIYQTQKGRITGMVITILLFLLILISGCSRPATQVHQEVISAISEMRREHYPSLEENGSNDTTLVFDCFESQLSEYLELAPPDLGEQSVQTVYEDMFGEGLFEIPLTLTRKCYCYEAGWEQNPTGEILVLPPDARREDIQGLMERTWTMDEVYEDVERTFKRHLRSKGVLIAGEEVMFTAR